MSRAIRGDTATWLLVLGVACAPAAATWGADSPSQPAPSPVAGPLYAAEPSGKTFGTMAGVAQQFADFADNELSSPHPPSAQLVSYQASLSESGGEDALNSLNRRVTRLEAERADKRSRPWW